MQSKIVGDFERGRVQNPSIPIRTKVFYRALYIPCSSCTQPDVKRASKLGIDLKPGSLVKFKKRAAIKKGGFGHHYYMVGGKRICPVHKVGERWVISTK